MSRGKVNRWLTRLVCNGRKRKSSLGSLSELAHDPPARLDREKVLLPPYLACQESVKGQRNHKEGKVKQKRILTRKDGTKWTWSVEVSHSSYWVAK